MRCGPFVRGTGMKQLALCALALASAGCVAVWGSSWHVETETPSGVTVRYDAALVDAETVQGHVGEICAKYQKNAVFLDRRDGVILPGGSVSEARFSCEYTAWSRADSTYQDYLKERYACIQDARAGVYNALYDKTGGAAHGAEVVDRGIFKACMSARGWTSGPEGFRPPQ
jgi:hypothetical protein